CAANAKWTGCALQPKAIRAENRARDRVFPPCAKFGRRDLARLPRLRRNREVCAWPPQTPNRCIGRREQRALIRPFGRLARAATNPNRFAVQRVALDSLSLSRSYWNYAVRGATGCC